MYEPRSVPPYPRSAAALKYERLRARYGVTFPDTVVANRLAESKTHSLAPKN